MSKPHPHAPTLSAIGPCPTVIKIAGHPGTGSLPSTIAPPDHPPNRNAIVRTNTIKYLHPSIKMKRERTHTKIDKRLRKTRTVYRMNSSFPRRWSISQLKQQQHLFYLFIFKITKQTKPGNMMDKGQYHSIDHIVEEHIQTLHVTLINYNRSTALERLYRHNMIH